MERNDVVLKYHHTLPNLGGQSPVLGIFFERETRIEDLEIMPAALYLRTDPETINRHLFRELIKYARLK